MKNSAVKVITSTRLSILLVQFITCTKLEKYFVKSFNLYKISNCTQHIHITVLTSNHISKINE